MEYTKKYFNPLNAGATPSDDGSLALGWNPDAVTRDVYVFSPRVVLAVNVARATRRPLLITGEPGVGKTRLASATAHVLEWQYYPKTVTSRTQASDLLWRFDALSRLNDATTPGRTLKPDRRYVDPEALWWGFDPKSAANRGSVESSTPADRAVDPAPPSAKDGAVVLIDEIDKADPDVPNDLLEPFDVRRFTVKETNDPIAATRDVLLVLTSNGERTLPPAFLRRCVALVLPEPDKAWFERIGGQHFPTGDPQLGRDVAAAVMQLRKETKAGMRKPSTAEYLDALRVCYDLRANPASAEWKDIADIVLLKRDPEARTRPSGSISAAAVANV